MTATHSRSTATDAVQTLQTRTARRAAAAHRVSPGPQTSQIARGAGVTETAIATLSNDMLRLGVAPHLGGGVTRFDWRGDGALTPIFRRCDAPGARTDPNELACYSLLPYSNRIGGGRFECDGRLVRVPRNRSAEPLPIHGDGWLAHWQLDDATDTQLGLSLDRSNGAPYAYRATQVYALDGATLTIALGIENTGATRLPFGLGVHPFIVRDASTELAAAASGLWLSTPDWLPSRHVGAPPAWRFGIAYPLPDTLVNHAFTGWGGGATIAYAAPARADGHGRRRLLCVVYAARRAVLLLRAGRSPDRRGEPAGRRRRARHDAARAGRAPDAALSLHRRAHRCARGTRRPPIEAARDRVAARPAPAVRSRERPSRRG